MASLLRQTGHHQPPDLGLAYALPATDHHDLDSTLCDCTPDRPNRTTQPMSDFAQVMELMQLLVGGFQAYQSFSAGLVQSARGPLSTLPGSCGMSGPGVLF